MQNNSSKKKNIKWVSILIALVVSIGLWLYVVTVENPSKDLTIENVPVRFVNGDILRENGLIISDTNVADGVTLKFVGRLSDLNKLKQGEEDIEVVIDVAHFTRAQEYKISFGLDEVVLPSSVSSRDFVLETKSPYDIKIQTSKLASKEIEVLLDAQITPKSDYTVGEGRLNYQVVNIEGPVDEIEQISHAQVSLQRENVDKTITTELPLSIVNKRGEIVDLDEAAVTVDVSSIEVEIPVKKQNVVAIKPVFVFGGGVTETDISVDVSPKEITIAGDAAILNGIDTIELPEINTAFLLLDEETITLEIPIPEGCEVVNKSDLVDDDGKVTATVTITISNKKTKTITVPCENFVCKVPGVSDFTFLTKELNVMIRANEQDINNITVDDIRVLVDLSKVDEVQGNNYTLIAEVTVEGFEGAGVIAVSDKDYEVTLSIASDD